MTRRQFTWQLGVRGTDLHTWPDEAAARALLGRSAEARAALADAIAHEHEPIPADAARVLSGFRRRMQATTPLRTGLRWAGLAACLGAGLLLAAVLAETAPDAFAIVQAGAMP